MFLLLILFSQSWQAITPSHAGGHAYGLVPAVSVGNGVRLLMRFSSPEMKFLDQARKHCGIETVRTPQDLLDSEPETVQDCGISVQLLWQS